MKNIKDMDYATKRAVVRSAFAGDQTAEIDGIVAIDVMRYMNVLKCVDIMRQAGYTMEQVEEQFKKTAEDGYTASEIIKNENGNIVALMELDPATLVPRSEGANGDYRQTFVQFKDSDHERILDADNVMYMAMPYTFNSIVEAIDNY